MKFRIKILVILILVPFQIYSQIKFFGTVKNGPKSSIVKLSYKLYNFFPESIEIESAIIDVNGHFEISALWPKAGHAKIEIQDEYADVFIAAGDSLTLFVNYNNFDKSIKFSGRGANENNYLAEEYLADFTAKPSKFLSEMSEDSYRKYVDNLQRSNYEFFRKHDLAGFSNDFIKNMDINLKYKFIEQRCWYELEGNIRSLKVRSLPSHYYSFFDRLELDLLEALNNEACTQALSAYTNYKLKQNIELLDSLELI